MKIKQTNITFVCSYNKCRSPLAEAIASAYINFYNLQNIIIQSHGVYQYLEEGETPCVSSIEEAKKYDLNIEKYLTKRLTKEIIKEMDYVFVMDKSNYNEVILKTLEEETSKIIYLNPNKENIEDPYEGTPKIFEKLFEELGEYIEYQFEELILKKEESN